MRFFGVQFVSEASLRKTLASETKIPGLITGASTRDCTLKLGNSDF